MDPEGFDGVATCIPVGVVKISVVGKMKAYDLFDTMLEGTVGHFALQVVILPHKGEGTLELYSFLLCGNTPDDREQGVQVLKPGVVVPLSRRLPHQYPPHPSL